MNVATLLFSELKDSNLFVDERRQVHIVLTQADSKQPLPLRSKDFANYLSRRAFALTGKVPSLAPIRATINLLEAQADQGTRVTLHNRVAKQGDSIWLDLAEPKGRGVCITKDGWNVLPAPALFHRYSHQEALPLPEPGGDLLKLCEFLNLSTEQDQMLYLVSLVVALVPDIPQPLLILHGPQGSAKTTAARLRRALIDPSAVKTVLLRNDQGELLQALDHHYMPIFDNLSSLRPWQEEILCQAATGAAFTKRRLYTDTEAVFASFHRPIILTGIGLPSAAPDLLDRSLLISLERLDPKKRLDETSLLGSFEAEKPKFVGALFTALARAMELLPTITPKKLTRMADFTRWGTACAVALGYSEEDFRVALENNVVRQGEEVLEGDVLAEAVRTLVERERNVSASATELLEQLREVSSVPSALPRRPAELGKRLTALQAPLSDLGISLTYARETDGKRGRRWVLKDSRLNALLKAARASISEAESMQVH